MQGVCKYIQVVIHTVFEIGNQFLEYENWNLNFDQQAKHKNNRKSEIDFVNLTESIHWTLTLKQTFQF